MRDAYRKKKTEIDSMRQSQHHHNSSPKTVRVLTIDDTKTVSGASNISHSSKAVKALPKAPSVAPSKKSSISKKSRATKYSDNLPLDKEATQIDCKHHHRKSTAEAFKENSSEQALSRRHTESSLLHRGMIHRSLSEDKVDMNLAYGKLPPDLTTISIRNGEKSHNRASTLVKMLDEATCLQYSITSTIENLQKNPDALAAVIKSLAEIGDSVDLMAPGTLSHLKSNLPDIMALLANSKLFLATAADLGIKIASLSGCKMDKSVKDESERQVIEEFEACQNNEGSELTVIENWRRKIADAKAESHGINSEGEYITPTVLSLTEKKALNDDHQSHVSSKSRAKTVDNLSTTKTSKTGGTSLSRAKSVKSVNTNKTSKTHESSLSRAKSLKSVITTKTNKTHETSQSKAKSVKSVNTTKTSKTHGTTRTDAKSVKSTKTNTKV